MQDVQSSLRRPRPHRAASSSRGVSLIYSLMALVALSLAAVALVRSVDTGNLVIGNLAFKKGATAAGDRAAEQAITWLSTRLTGSTLHAENAASAYYAAVFDELDASGNASASASRVVVDWDNNTCSGAGAYSRCLAASNALSVGGNSAKYVIMRLCSAPGDPAGGGTTCVMPLSGTTVDDTNHSDINYARQGFPSTNMTPYYRIVVRSMGPKGTRSFTDTVVHF